MADAAQRRHLTLTCFCIALAIARIESVTRDQLFPHGLGFDRNLPNDAEDTHSAELVLTTPLVFYDQQYNSIFVNENGLVSLTTELPSFFNVPLPLDYPVIAPFYSDVDLRSGGSVWFRESQNSADIKKSSGMVQQYFSSGRNFESKRVVVVTWDHVGYYELGNNTENTFQLIVATNAEETFAFFIYLTDGIQWVQGTGKNPNLPDARAQAGFVSEDGRFYSIRGSGTDQISNLDKWSNVGVPGLWIFNIGRISPAENILLPDLVSEDSFDELEKATNCSQGSTICHSKAVCVDYNPGFCCRCSSGHYGNGRNCLPDGVPQRVNGKISAHLNGVVIKDEDLHSYVATADGRAYTAFSRVPGTLGYDLQSLSIIGSVVGWLFAKSVDKAPNGYQLTGGVFNHTAKLDFPQTGHSVAVVQRFLGVDVFNNLRVEVTVNGSVPSVPYGSKIEIPDYEEEYTHVGLGELRSRAQRSFRIEGSTLDIPFSVDHRIVYDECSAAKDRLETLRLKVGRNFVTYDSRDQIARYAMTCKILTLNASEDPCSKGRETCGPNSSCVVQGDSFRCVCNKGFEAALERGPRGDRLSCLDVNECDTGLDHCSEYAICINEPGSYSCRCKEGYQGDGFNCQRISPCSHVRCGANAQCSENQNGDAECRCLDGFEGNGFLCLPKVTGPDCRQVSDLCDINAQCEYSSNSNAYRCNCKPGYRGDGIVCLPESETCDVAAICDPFATCVFDENVSSHVCRCLPGFEGDGYRCASVREAENPASVVQPKCVLDVCWCDEGLEYRNGRCEPPNANPTQVEQGDLASCDKLKNCHQDAECALSPSSQDYVCHCKAGFYGDGYQCYPLSDVSDERDCDQQDFCAANATCIYNDYSLKPECVCNSGFRGDGYYTCTPTDGCSSLLDCDENAQCLFDTQESRYQCRCNEGYTGDGKSCSPQEIKEESSVSSSTCDVLNNCHPNADCIYDDEGDRYVCSCRPGYSGNGYQCQSAVIGCNVINNCDRNADCLYDVLSIGYRCKCKEGFAGDGQFCRPARKCSEDLSICNSNAKCVWNSAGESQCQCREGFIGDGFECKPLSKHEGNFLLVTQGMSVLKIPLEASAKTNGRPIHIGIFQSAIGIDIDCIEGRAYWGDVTSKAIRSIKYDGTDHRYFLNGDVGSPEGVAVDWASRNIYWTDSERDTIEVANLDTKVRKTLFNTSLVNPRGIAVHPSRGLLFWSDWNRENPKIERSSTDGSDRIVLVRDGIALPNSLSVDPERDEICWADAGTRKIECAGLDGSNRRTVRTDVKHPFGLAQYDGQLYWTDWEDNFVRSAPKSSEAGSRKLSVPLGGQGKLYGLVAVPQSCPSVWSPCQIESGGCVAEELCLPNGRGGRSCLQ